MFKKACLLVLLLGCVFLATTFAQETEEIIFSGVPIVKISEGGVNRVAENVKEEQVFNEDSPVLSNVFVRQWTWYLASTSKRNIIRQRETKKDGG